MLGNKDVWDDLRKIPGGLACLPEGSRIIPACNFDPNKKGWIVLPPEEKCNSEEAFKEWKDSMYNNAIVQGLKGKTAH